jgi:hypothetical protein
MWTTARRMTRRFLRKSTGHARLGEWNGLCDEKKIRSAYPGGFKDGVRYAIP